MEEKRKIGMDLFIFFGGGGEGVFEDVLKFESCRIM